MFSCSVVSNSGTPWAAACQVSLSFTISWSLLKLLSTEWVMPSNHLIFCHPRQKMRSLLLPPSIFLSIRVFSSELALCIQWPKYWSFRFNISLSSAQQFSYLGDLLSIGSAYVLVTQQLKQGHLCIFTLSVWTTGMRLVIKISIFSI